MSGKTMRFRSLLVVALLALWFTAINSSMVSAHSTGDQKLTSTAPASGSKMVQTMRVTQTSRQIQVYWTPARMKAARPMSDPVVSLQTLKHAATRSPDGPAVSHAPVKPRNTKLFSNASPLPTGLYSTYPYSTIGKIFFTENGSPFVCSGAAIVSNNKNAVDTAGHCVIAGGSGNQWFGNWLFCPGYYYQMNSSRCWSGRQAWASNDWIYSGSGEDDFGEIVVWANGLGNLTDVVGGAGWAYNYAANQYFTALGYPSEGAFNGQSIYDCSGTGTGSGLDDGTSVTIPCNMTRGSSGGPWFITINGSTGYINGHNDRIDSISAPTIMMTPYYDGDWYNVYNGAQNVF